MIDINPEQVDINDIILYIDKCRSRKTVLRTLYKNYPNNMTIKEICNATELDLTSVRGALKGCGTKYSEKGSLINMELVEPNTKRKAHLYKITPIGRFMIESIHFMNEKE